MSPAVRGTVERRVLVNYRIDVEKLDKVLSNPFRGREVGESGKGLCTVCLTRVENARPRLLPGVFGVSGETVTHRVYARVEESGEHCVYVPRRDASSGFHAFVLGSLLPTEFDRCEFREKEKQDRKEIRADCGRYFVGVAYDGDRDELDDGSVFYSVESASTFLCESGAEYALSDGVYKGVEPLPEEKELDPVEVSDARSSYFEKIGAEFDSAFKMEGTEYVWEPHSP